MPVSTSSPSCRPAPNWSTTPSSARPEPRRTAITSPISAGRSPTATRWCCAIPAGERSSGAAHLASPRPVSLGRCRSTSIPCTPASAPGTSSSPARRSAIATTATPPGATTMPATTPTCRARPRRGGPCSSRSTAWITSRRWASTSSISHRSIRSAPPSARAATTQRPQPPRTWAVPGRSDPPTADTARSTPTWAASTTSRRSRRRVVSAGCTSRSTSRSSAHPTTRGCTNIRSGSRSDPTAASSTPRTRPRSTRTSSRSTSSPTTGRGCGRHSPTSSASGSSAGSPCSASTILTPRRSPSGNGRSPRCVASTPKRSSSPSRSRVPA
jgi:hypothetical protein